eukprot:TRINITY_DN3481_c0_g1_i1.p1 TRINITY_DN3481_c0_g1~~TRINITY_DN3481_c0_g1_i1.p1  ORF type:complete len:1029 (-),score=268.75 TRINITY_DN3481_c0_g1_i1:46-3132(-)
MQMYPGGHHWNTPQFPPATAMMQQTNMGRTGVRYYDNGMLLSNPAAGSVKSRLDRLQAELGSLRQVPAFRLDQIEMEMKRVEQMSSPVPMKSRLDRLEAELNSFRQAMAPGPSMTRPKSNTKLAPLDAPTTNSLLSAGGSVAAAASPAPAVSAPAAAASAPSVAASASAPNVAASAPLPPASGPSPEHQQLMAAHSQLMAVVQQQQAAHSQLLAAHSQLLAKHDSLVQRLDAQSAAALHPAVSAPPLGGIEPDFAAANAGAAALHSAATSHYQQAPVPQGSFGAGPPASAAPGQQDFFAAGAGAVASAPSPSQEGAVPAGYEEDPPMAPAVAANQSAVAAAASSPAPGAQQGVPDYGEAALGPIAAAPSSFQEDAVPAGYEEEAPMAPAVAPGGQQGGVPSGYDEAPPVAPPAGGGSQGLSAAAPGQSHFDDDFDGDVPVAPPPEDTDEPAAAPATASAGQPAAEAAQAPAVKDPFELPPPVVSPPKAPSLGIVRLDHNFPPAEGDVAYPGSFGYEVFYEVIKGLTPEVARSGSLSPEVELKFREALVALEARGVNAITGDSSFLVAFQDIAKKQAEAPAFMTSLVQCGVVASAIDPDQKVLLLTGSEGDLKSQHEILKTSCGIDVEGPQFKILGCQDLKGFDAVAKGEKLNLDVVQPNLLRLVMGALKADRSIRAIVLEHAQLPPFADALRCIAKMPVWDAITAADFYISASADNPRFGIDEWQQSCEAGTSSSSSVDPSRFEKQKETLKKLKKRDNPCLGILRLDGARSTQHLTRAASYGYEMKSRTVDGLTVEVAMSGQLDAAVEKKLKEAIQGLEKDGCVCITADSSFMIAFQAAANKFAKVPCFMSCMMLCPMVVAAFAKADKIIVLTESVPPFQSQKENLRKLCGFDMDDTRFVIGGCDEVPAFLDAIDGTAADAEQISAGLIALVKELMADQLGVAAIFAESALLPPYSDALRKEFRMPVFDAISGSDFFVSAFQDNPRFGLNQWQNDWELQAESEGILDSVGDGLEKAASGFLSGIKSMF